MVNKCLKGSEVGGAQLETRISQMEKMNAKGKHTVKLGNYS